MCFLFLKKSDFCYFFKAIHQQRHLLLWAARVPTTRWTCLSVFNDFLLSGHCFCQCFIFSKGHKHVCATFFGIQHGNGTRVQETGFNVERYRKSALGDHLPVSILIDTLVVLLAKGWSSVPNSLFYNLLCENSTLSRYRLTGKQYLYYRRDFKDFQFRSYSVLFAST